ncbi:MAG: orotidine-5'-phosphate decarboxylase [Planctomycetes bacterium]|nr:orotidine-5'-phosphate decarboxylase [Planctomycetota bacterium]
MSYADRLQDAIQAKGTPALVGLDPFLDRIPEDFAGVHDPNATVAERASAMGDFLCAVVDVVADRVPAVKPQSAFFEVLGAAGVAQWERVVRHARRAGLIVVGDVKRGDIGSTAAAYAEAFLTGARGVDPETLCDAVTVNPLLGDDSITPFLEACTQASAGIYILVRTSNPGGAQFQLQGQPTLTEHIADAVVAWGEGLIGASGLSSVGAVVGATHPAELASLRARMPRTPLLLPGYGAQGAGAAEVASGFLEGGRGALVNSSRGILYPARDEGEDWRTATSRAVDRMRADLGAVWGGA